MDELHISTTDDYLSVFLMTERNEFLRASMQVSHVSNGDWYFNRALVKNDEDRGKGLGTRMLARLKEELKKKPNFKRLIVEPGGYGSEPKRQRGFYLKRGFFPHKDGYLEWRG